jgi:hypothetical protein
MSPVLNRMLFGVDLITVDPTVPIVWPDFDTEVVEAVFVALRKRKGHICVPSEGVPLALTFLDFIGELDFIQVLRSDISFEEVRNINFTQVFCDEAEDVFEISDRHEKRFSHVLYSRY